EIFTSLEFRRVLFRSRKLDQLGALSYNVARQPADIRLRMEEFLLLEAAGWKGRGRTAMINDRYRAAFAREAISNLAETDSVRIQIGRASCRRRGRVSE